MTITAKIIADSINEDGIRLTTLQLKYPRFIHSEFMTHRSLSRSASSSRAISVAIAIKMVENDMAFPIHWGANQAGMQAWEELPEREMELAKAVWRHAGVEACARANRLMKIGVHKQVVNRLIEPFSHIHVVVTATEWSNFFALRTHKDAQPEIQQLARVMRDAMQSSYPRSLAFGDWHIPYVTEDIPDEVAIKCSAARCARVSYANHDGTDPDIDKDIALYHKLVDASPPHMSPVEHAAMAVPGGRFFANFRGWRQHRWDIEHAQD